MKNKNQNKAFADLLRRKGYNQKQFAEALGVKPATLNGWLFNRYKPTPFNLAKIARQLEVDIAELDEMFFGGE